MGWKMTGTHQFDLFCTSARVLRPFWSRSTGRSTVLVEVKSVGRSTEKVEMMRTQNDTFKMKNRKTNTNFMKL